VIDVEAASHKVIPTRLGSDGGSARGIHLGISCGRGTGGEQTGGGEEQKKSEGHERRH
jgi:hypothetical protein